MTTGATQTTNVIHRGSKVVRKIVNNTEVNPMKLIDKVSEPQIMEKYYIRSA